MALARKAPNLLALNPDIAVIQECSEKSVEVLHGHGLSGLWFGANPNKGLAVFCSAQFKVKAVDKLFGKWVVPVRVHGAVAAFKLASDLGLPGRDKACRQLHRGGSPMPRKTSWLVQQRTRCRGWRLQQQCAMGREPPGRNHTEVVRLFGGHGLISAYHAHHGEKQGTETRPTYYFYRHRDKPFHIDYVFVPTSWRLSSVEVGSFREWGHLSDHVPVVADVSIGGGDGSSRR